MWNSHSNSNQLFRKVKFELNVMSNFVHLEAFSEIGYADERRLTVDELFTIQIFTKLGAIHAHTVVIAEQSCIVLIL